MTLSLVPMILTPCPMTLSNAVGRGGAAYDTNTMPLWPYQMLQAEKEVPAGFTLHPSQVDDDEGGDEAIPKFRLDQIKAQKEEVRYNAGCIALPVVGERSGPPV